MRSDFSMPLFCDTSKTFLQIVKTRAAIFHQVIKFPAIQLSLRMMEYLPTWHSGSGPWWNFNWAYVKISTQRQLRAIVTTVSRLRFSTTHATDIASRLSAGDASLFSSPGTCPFGSPAIFGFQRISTCLREPNLFLGCR